MSARSFFTDAQVKEISAAIAAAEAKTSGEVRVHIEKKCAGEALKEAENWFGKLGMHKTRDRNGILIYLAVESHVFAIYGDKGIHEKVHQEFWNEISHQLEDKFRAGLFTEGLAEVIHRIGEQLQKYFPLGANDKDELTNDVSFQ
jgi:uncharacterized membrane protein